jgi:serine protease Do
MRLPISKCSGGEIIIEDKPKAGKHRNLNEVDSEETILEEYEYTEEDFLFDDVDEDELIPSSTGRWIKRIVVCLVAIMLLGNLIAFFPTVFNLQAIQFLKKTRQLSQIVEIQQYKKAIVVVKVDDRKGTGFNIDEQGLIITNAHVVGDAKFAYISFDEGGILRAEVMVTDPSIDIAILRVRSEGDQSFPTLSLVQISNGQQGHRSM